MTYLDIVNLVFGILGGFLSLLAIHFILFAIVGVFAKKKFPKTDEKLKYGLIIPARNEEAVVGKLIESIQRANYPQDKLHIFLIAHNCTDGTADVGRSLGATVYEYNNPEECTMGYAFRYLFDRISEDYGIDNYDGFFLFNADNIVDENFFDKMNDAFVAEGRKNIITSFRNSKNFGTNTMSACYGLYFAYGCRYESRGRSVIGCSTRVQGTGYVVPRELVKDGWKYVTLTEDWEFTADRVIENQKIVFCDEAMFYDEQPLSIKVMIRQRLRWARGHLLVCTTRLKDLFCSLFKSKKKGGSAHKFSTYDLSINILPVCVIATVFFLLQTVAVLLAPAFFPQEYNFVDVLLTHLFGIARGFVGTYAGLALASILLYILERKRIRKVGILTRITSVLVFPIFLLLSAPLEVCSLFMKNLGWKPIPHGDNSNVHELMNTEPEAEAKTEQISE